MLVSLERLAALGPEEADLLARPTERLQAILGGFKPPGRRLSRGLAGLEDAVRRMRAAFGDTLSPDIRLDNLMARRLAGGGFCPVLNDPYGVIHQRFRACPG